MVVVITMQACICSRVWVRLGWARAGQGAPSHGARVQSKIPPPLPGSPLPLQVRCQANELSAREVMKDLLQSGINVDLVRKLYAGVFGAALCAVLVGAVHYASYETTRKALIRAASQPNGAEAASQSSRPGAGVGGKEAAPSTSNASSSSSSSSSSSNTVSGGHANSSAGHVSKEQRMMANVVAALVASVVTAVVESPVELFRHNQQAGVFKVHAPDCTASGCTARRGRGCTARRGRGCTARRGLGCTARRGHGCTARRGRGCTARRGHDCTARRGHGCTARRGHGCTARRGHGCTGRRGRGCTAEHGIRIQMRH